MIRLRLNCAPVELVFGRCSRGCVCKCLWSAADDLAHTDSCQRGWCSGGLTLSVVVSSELLAG
jgi:hypothetical protein